MKMDIFLVEHYTMKMDIIIIFVEHYTMKMDIIFSGTLYNENGYYLPKFLRWCPIIFIN